MILLLPLLCVSSDPQHTVGVNGVLNFSFGLVAAFPWFHLITDRRNPLNGSLDQSSDSNGFFFIFFLLYLPFSGYICI